MLGAGLHSGRSRGDDRSYNPVKARKINQEQIRRAQSDISGVLKEEKSVTWTSKESDESRKPNAAPGDEPMLSKSSNLERFLESVIPTVPAQYLSKVRFDYKATLWFIIILLWKFFCLIAKKMEKNVTCQKRNGEKWGQMKVKNLQFSFYLRGNQTLE